MYARATTSPATHLPHRAESLNSIAGATRAPDRVNLGRLWVNTLDSAGALDAIDRLIDAGNGGAVFTPNVDHLVKAEDNAAFRAAYANASLSLADGMPLVWLARLVGKPLPARVAGSEMTMPLMTLAARRGWRVYLLGGAPGVAENAAAYLRDAVGVNVVGWDCPAIRPDGSDVSGDSVSRAAAAAPDIIIAALGAPKQELWIERARQSLRHTVGFGLGGSLDFVIGRCRKAPGWVSSAGLEWLYRLVQEPKRLWRRYLVEGPRFVGIAWRTWRDRGERQNEL